MLLSSRLRCCVDILYVFSLSIVNSRSGQRNFQLIVITHDEEFLQGLAHADDIRTYYRVYRDDQ